MRFSTIQIKTAKSVFQHYGFCHEFAADQIVSERNSEAKWLYFVEAGQLRAFFADEDGQELSLFYIGPDNIVCLESLIGCSASIVSISAAVPSRIWRIDADRFLDAWSDAGYSVTDLLTHFVKRILLLSDYLCCMRFQSSEARIAYFLYSLYADDETPIAYTHAQISEMTGTGRSSCERILRRFQKNGLIRCGYRNIEIIDPDALSEFFGLLGYHSRENTI